MGDDVRHIRTGEAIEQKHGGHDHQGRPQGAPRRFQQQQHAYGANDDIVPPEASRQMIANLPDAPDSQRRIAIYEDGYHMLLRDLQGDVVLRDILTWIKDPARDLPSGADKGDPHLRFTKR